jgi:hypothetical protein
MVENAARTANWTFLAELEAAQPSLCAVWWRSCHDFPAPDQSSRDCKAFPKARRLISISMDWVTRLV